MPRQFTLATLAPGLMLVLALAVAPARASFDTTVVPTVTPQGGGGFLYSYRVNVLGTSTSPLSEFDLNVTNGVASGINTPIGATLTSITVQTGFQTIYTPGDPTISFFSSDPSFDVRAGSTALFSFLSPFSPASQPYQVTSFDANGIPTTVTGVTVGPVPEPASLVLFGLGAAGVVGWHARGRGRRAVTPR